MTRFIIPAFLTLVLLAAPLAQAAEETGAGAAGVFSAEGETLTGEAAPAEEQQGGQTDVPGEGCTQMWCQEGLTINLNGSDWPAATYDFVVMLDGKATRCSATLPFKNCETSVTCNNSNVTIGESGCALEAHAHSFNSITSKLSPEQVGFAIRRSDGKFFAWERESQKICTYPNGAKCDTRECCSVYAEVDVVWEDQVPKQQ